MAVVRLPRAVVKIDPVKCDHRYESPTLTPRCERKRPRGWPETASALIWIAQGGSLTVFGECSLASCPRIPEESVAC